MLDALNRAKRRRELAAGCHRVAAIGLSSETRVSWMAERYGKLAKAEESAALRYARRPAGEAGSESEQALANELLAVR